jgi:predicted RNase H-like HicB family nuclease
MEDDMKKVYPALFVPEDGGYSVSFPDIPGCFTEGDNLAEAIEMAQEALGVYVAYLADNEREIPESSAISELDSADGFLSYISADVNKYRRNGKSVKKTLTIPEWLNLKAEKASVNFSKTLQDALETILVK